MADVKEMVQELKRDKAKRQEGVRTNSKAVAKDIATYWANKVKGKQYFYGK